MTVPELLALLEECPLVASVQASPGSPVDDPETLLKLAQASLTQGVRILRLEGIENISFIKKATLAPIIGLIKRRYEDSNLYITPTIKEVEELIETGCEIIAIDCRSEPWYGKGEPTESRPNGERLEELVQVCHNAGRLVLADCDGCIDLTRAQRAGCDLGSTTFGRQRIGEETFTKPCFHNLRMHLLSASIPILAEGGYQTESQIRTALRMGAKGVVIGGAINDPIKQTAKFIKSCKSSKGKVGAVDIGGTWIRFGVFDEDFRLLAKSRMPVQSTHEARFNWICKQAEKFGVTTIGVSTGGVYDPWLNWIRESKDTILDNSETSFVREGLSFRALNDGLATAWGHEVWLERTKKIDGIYPGETNVTLAIGTGLGCGIVCNSNFLTGCDYPRINDLLFDENLTFEEVLGGKCLGINPTHDQQERAFVALNRAIEIVSAVVQPSNIILSGGVITSKWMLQRLGNPGRGKVINLKKLPFLNRDSRQFGWLLRSPHDPNAGLFGAAALALYPPIGVFPE